MTSASSSVPATPRRSQAETLLAAHLTAPFMLLPPTTRFPHMSVAHGDLGLCAVVVHDDTLMHDEDRGIWWGQEAVDPVRMAAQASLDLAAAARAPAERVTGVAWLRNGIAHSPPPDGVVAGPDAELMAYTVQRAMERRLVGTDEPVSPWLGAYAHAALGPADPTPRPLRRLVQLIERCLRAEFEDRPAVIETVEIPPQDLCDPRFMLPALLACAHEDLSLLKVQQPGSKAPVKAGMRPAFHLELAADPGAFLGYRVASVTPAHPFFVLDPVVVLARRYRYHDEYLFDDMLGQFGRYLHKNGLDALVVEEALAQIRSRAEMPE